MLAAFLGHFIKAGHNRLKTRGHIQQGLLRLAIPGQGGHFSPLIFRVEGGLISK
jgi:hypothetical protein